MPERLRCGVIGAGGIGWEHLQSLIHCPRGSAVAIAEANPQRAKEASDRFRIPRSYTDYQELLDQPDIDAVTIALPNHLHATVAAQALSARKHVFLEKPMATNGRDAARLVETAKKMRRVLMVGQNFRFHRATQHARQVISQGELGTVYHARCWWLRRWNIPRIGSWFTQKEFAGGGAMLDIGVHMLDTALYLMGEFDVTAVTAAVTARFGPRNLGEFEYGHGPIDPKRPFDVEDFGSAFLRLKSGRTLLLEASWAAYTDPDRPEYGAELLGTNGGLSVFPPRLFRRGPLGQEIIHIAPAPPPLPEDRLHYFVQCALDGRKPIVAPEESVKVQKVLDAIYTSSRTGREARLA